MAPTKPTGECECCRELRPKVDLLWGAMKWIVLSLGSAGVAAVAWLVKAVLHTQGLRP